MGFSEGRSFEFRTVRRDMSFAIEGVLEELVLSRFVIDGVVDSIL